MLVVDTRGSRRAVLPAVSWHVLGKHREPTCADEEHVEGARLRVAQAFANEMMDLYGDVPERRS